MRTVVDGSVAAKWYFDEPGCEAADRILAAAVDPTGRLWGVPYVWYELLRLTPLGGAAACGLYIGAVLWGMARWREHIWHRGGIFLFLLPFLFNQLLLLGSTPRIEELGWRLVLKADGLELLATTQDVGQAHEDLEAKYEGAELTVAFNPEYLAQGIDVTPGDEIVLETIDALKPAVLRSTEDAGFLYLLMPVRVS